MKTRTEEDSTSKIRSKKNRFLVCFFPVEATGKNKPVGKTSSDSYDSNPALNYSYISVPMIISSKSEIGEDPVKPRRKIARRFFALITGKVRTGKVQQEPIRSEKSEERPIPLPKKKRIEKSDGSSRGYSDSVTDSSSSIGSKGSSSKSSSSRRNSNSESPSLTDGDRCRNTLQVAGKFEPLTGLYLLAISLSILLIWGRVCAIVCMLTWLYFLPRRESVNIEPESGEELKSGNFQTSEDKKKVIMEGLLERSHRV